jgi:hypothetical protein
VNPRLLICLEGVAHDFIVAGGMELSPNSSRAASVKGTAGSAVTYVAGAAGTGKSDRAAAIARSHQPQGKVETLYIHDRIRIGDVTKFIESLNLSNAKSAVLVLSQYAVSEPMKKPTANGTRDPSSDVVEGHGGNEMNSLGHGSTEDGSRGPLPVNLLLHSLCYNRCLYDPSTGVSHVLPPNLHLVVEVPSCRDAGEVHMLIPVTKFGGALENLSKETIVDRLNLTDSTRLLAQLLYHVEKDQLKDFASRCTAAASTANTYLFPDYAKASPLSDEQLRQDVIRYVPAEFTENFQTLTCWLKMAAHQLAFVNKVFFSSWVMGMCKECRGRSTCKPNCKAFEDLRTPICRDLIPGILREVSWFCRMGETISATRFQQELDGACVLPDPDGLVIPCLASGLNGAIPRRLNSVSMIFSGAEESYLNLEKRLDEKLPAASKDRIRRFHTLVAKLLTPGMDESVLLTYKRLKEMKFVVTEDTFVRYVAIYHRIQAGYPYIISSSTGVGKSYQLKSLQQLMCIEPWKRMKNGFMGEFIRVALNGALQHARDSGLNLPNLAAADENCEDPLLWAQLLSTVADAEDAAYASLAQKPPYAVIQKLQEGFNALKDQPKNAFLKWDANLPEIFDRALTSKEEFAALCEAIVNVDIGRVVHKLLIHPGLTEGDVSKFMAGPMKAVKDMQNHDALRGVKVLVFLDELNTGSIPGFLKHLMMDRVLNGERLDDRIVFVAAINPHGVADEQYSVEALPESMECCVQRFVGYSAETRKRYIREAIAFSGNAKLINSEDPEVMALADLIELAHAYSEGIAKEVQEGGGRKELCGPVSQRDIQRVITLTSTISRMLEGIDALSDRERMRYAVVSAVYFSYVSRLDSRAPLERLLTAECRKVLEDERIDVASLKRDVVRFIVNDDRFEIPHGIALTDALAENILLVLLTVTCPQPKVPMAIIGKPWVWEDAEYPHRCCEREGASIAEKVL